MINITPDLEQFSLGEPGGTVSMKPNTGVKKAPAKAVKSCAKAPAKAASSKCTCKKAASSKKAKEPAAGSAFPALDAGPSGPMFDGGMFMDGPSGPMFDGPSGPMR